MKNITFFIVCVLFLSCNNVKKETLINKQNVNNVQLIVEFKSLVNDRFRVYYTINEKDEINGDYQLVNYTYGSDTMQSTIFTFPVGAFPYKIRLDLGENQKNEHLTVKNISIKYKNKILDGNYGKFMDYWSNNECLIFNNETFEYDIIPSANGKKGPLLISNPKLENELLTFFE